MKKVLAILVIVLSIIQVQAQEAYGVLIGEGLTIYYDDLRSSREGETFDMYKNSNAPAWLSTENVKTIKKVVFDSSIADYRPTRLEYLFYGFSSLCEIDGINLLNTGNVTTMGSMFGGCSGLTSLDLSNFNTSNVTNMGSMFGGCSGLTSLDLSNFNTSNVTNMGSMFGGCSGLTSLDLSNFNTSNVTNMGSMFYSCTNIVTINVSSFDTSNVTNMRDMFSQCSSLLSLDLSNFDTKNTTSMGGIFSQCSSLKYLNIKNFTVRDESGGISFVGLKNLETLDVSNVDFSHISSMVMMFYGCSSLTNLDLSNYNTSNVTDMSLMFGGCSSLISLDLSSFNTSQVTNMRSMFYECKSLQNLDLSHFDTSNVTNMSWMFRDCNSLSQLNIDNFDTRNVTDMNEMFIRCSSLKTIDVSRFDTKNVTDMWGMFYGCNNLEYVDVSHFITTNVTSMGYMFADCYNLRSINVSNFDTSNLDDAPAGQTYVMFLECSSLKEIILGDKFTRISNQTFQQCRNLESVTIGKNVKSIGDYAFNACGNIKTINSHIEQPFAFATNAFDYPIYKNAILNVPTNTKSLYQSTAGWKEFKDIAEFSGGNNNQDLEPVDKGDNTDYGNGDINENTDLNGNVIGNIYYNISDENGEYSSTEGCIILRKPTSDTDMNNLEGQDIFGEDFKNGFTGIVFMVQGSGTIKVNAESVGSMTLKVKIGNNAPMTFELEGKMKASIPYSVTEPTYVYIYGGETTANARGLRAASSDNALKIYGIEWSETTTNIESILDNVNTNVIIYNLQGQRMKAVTKGINIINGKKVIVK